MTKRGPGRPALSEEEKRKYTVRLGMTEPEYRSFREFMDTHSLTDEAVALRKLFLDRMKADGHMRD